MANPIPLSFIKSLTKLSWVDAAWGYHRHLLSWSSASEFACDQLVEGADNSNVLDLAGLTKSEAYKTGELLDKLALQSKSQECETESKWLYLCLAWLFENRGAISDPLGEVETIYADFGYPEQIKSFVRYMPADASYNPSVHTIEENRNRLFSKWEKFLADNSSAFR